MKNNEILEAAGKSDSPELVGDSVKSEETGNEEFSEEPERRIEATSAEMGDKDKTTAPEKNVAKKKKSDHESRFPSGVIKIHRKEDPLFNTRNLIFVSITLGIFLIFVLAMSYYGSKTANEKRFVYSFNSPNRVFHPICSGGKHEKITFVKDVPGMKAGGCLKLSYTNDVDKFIGIVTINPRMKNFKEILLRIRSAEDRIFGISVEEITGPVYIYTIKLKANKWTDVSATPEKFILSGHSRDPNDKFNTDMLVNRLVIADLSGDRGIVGPNTFWVEKVVIEKE